MSGGAFEYKNDELLREIFGYDRWKDDKDFKVPNRFQDLEISNLVYDVLRLIHDYDWYESGDTGEGNWVQAKEKFKDRWLRGNAKERISQYAQEALEQFKKELLQTCSLADVPKNIRDCAHCKYAEENKKYDRLECTHTQSPNYNIYTGADEVCYNWENEEA